MKNTRILSATCTVILGATLLVCSAFAENTPDDPALAAEGRTTNYTQYTQIPDSTVRLGEGRVYSGSVEREDDGDGDATTDNADDQIPIQVKEYKTSQGLHYSSTTSQSVVSDGGGESSLGEQEPDPDEEEQDYPGSGEPAEQSRPEEPDAPPSEEAQPDLPKETENKEQPVPDKPAGGEGPAEEQPGEQPEQPDKQEESEPTAPSVSCVVNTADGAVVVTGSPNPQEANAVLDEINRAREQAGLPQLVWDDCLAASALERGFECAVSFSHTRPDGSQWYTVNTGANGENLAKGQPDATSVVGAWMNSAGHRANILRQNFTRVGIACVQTDNGIFWVQLFGI